MTGNIREKQQNPARNQTLYYKETMWLRYSHFYIRASTHSYGKNV